MSAPAVGIDLGTRFALVAVRQGGDRVPVIVRNRWGGVRTPAFVARSSGVWLAGEDAAKMALLSPERTWWNVKRYVGSSEWYAHVEGKRLGAEEMLVPLIALLREDTEAFLGNFVTSCVLAVPAHFSFPERAAMVRAACQAGFEQVRIVNEPTAAALAVGGQGRSLVLDFGAGTVDVSVVEREGDVWQVVESQGRADIGGIDLDRILADGLVRKVLKSPMVAGDRRLPLLLAEAEQIKIALSDAQSMTWFPPQGLRSEEGTSVLVSRDYFETLAEPLLAEVVALVRKLWHRHKPKRLMLVGGSSRIPLLRRMLAASVAEPDHLRICPDEAVALGAAFHAAQGEGRLLIDVLSQSLGVEAADASVIPLLEKGTPLPASAARRFAALGGNVVVPVVQGSGARGRHLGTVSVPGGQGEEVEILFEVDAGGLLRVEVRRRDGSTATCEVLDVEGAPRGEASRRRAVAELERRVMRLALELDEEQEERISRLLSRLRALEGQDAWDEARSLVEDMVRRMEEAMRT